MAQTSATASLLTSAPVACTLTTTDLDRCRDFYENRLGLKVNTVESDGIEFAGGNGTELYIYLRNEPPQATNTAAAFHVPNVEATVNALRSNGVKFEEYDLPGLKTVDGIATTDNWKAAWFKDPDGNIIGISNR